MLITINRKTSMHLFAQNNHGISELFLATLRVEQTQKSQRIRQMVTRKWLIQTCVKTDLLSRGILCHGWLPVRQTLF
jgi:hypothetical protein